MAMHTKRVLFVILTMGLCFSAHAEPWLGGYKISLEGFGESAPYSKAAHFGVHTYFSPIKWDFLRPSLSAGLLFSVNAKEPGVIFEGNMDLRLATVLEHPLKNLFLRSVAWTPTVQLSFLCPLADREIYSLSVSAQIMSFFFGEKTVSVAGFRLVYIPYSDTWSWGIRLLELSQALY